MNLEAIEKGESKTIEYKAERPKDSKKYMKTVVAFANGNGGVLVFGVEDSSHAIVGVPKSMLFAEMDAIANAISDSCEPKIIPEISLKEIDGKTIIIVEITQGMERPYYIASMGMQDGTFIRVAGTTRQVERYMLKELIVEGSGRSLDSLTFENETVSDAAIKKTCKAMTAYAKSRCETAIERKNVKPLTKNQLISWELLVEKEGKLLPTYGYKLLAGDDIPPALASVQCSVFKGSTRAVFVDRKEYDGPLYEQIDAAYDFVLRMIRMGVKINGVVRQDIYEFPVATIREMICNAVCHRSYLQPAHVQVALYDDRLEVTSPGMLARDVSLTKMKEGFSKLRNRGIARAFAYMHIIEGWGSGIPRMVKECKEYGLKEPELIDAEGDFRVNLYRSDPIAQKKSKVPKSKVPKSKVPKSKVPKNTLEDMLLQLIAKDNAMSSEELSKEMGVAKRSIQRIINNLKQKDRIERLGGKRYGYWSIND